MTGSVNGPACCSDRDARRTAEEQMKYLNNIEFKMSNKSDSKQQVYQKQIISNNTDYFLKYISLTDKASSTEIMILNFSMTFNFESRKKWE